MSTFTPQEEQKLHEQLAGAIHSSGWEALDTVLNTADVNAHAALCAPEIIHGSRDWCAGYNQAILDLRGELYHLRHWSPPPEEQAPGDGGA